ncbi:MAG: glycerophosphodiester phosphodiesterase [Methanobrevibacter sp.]|nr:glycerophosphodiester phosphodiesterase [Candidatus Methanovirga procula]
MAADYIKHHINPNMTIISHRGASGEVVEHTFEAYDNAINEGNNLIEQDVQTSKDGTLWVSHDESSERITGVKKNYSDMNDNEISKLHTENGENIHTLEEVLERYGIDNNIIFVIELKNGSSQVDNFLSLVRKYDVVNRTIVQSFEYEGIESAIKKRQI